MSISQRSSIALPVVTIGDIRPKVLSEQRADSAKQPYASFPSAVTHWAGRTGFITIYFRVVV